MKKEKRKEVKDKVCLIDLTNPLLVNESFETKNLIYFKGKLYLKKSKEDEDKPKR
jgi:hypothetical protein